jgi:hypothetical protein
VLEATYFWVVLIQLANDSSLDVGQYPANWVNVTWPISTASCPSSASTTPSIELNSPEYTLRM